MNMLSLDKRAAILLALCEGNGVRATARLTGTNKETVMKLLVDVGEFALVYQDQVLRNLPCTRIEADEIWAFVGAKQRRARRPSHGDIWTFTAICPESKLVVSWLVGARTPENAAAFMKDVAARLTNRVQLTTDGHGMYLLAVRQAFGFARVDYAQLVKHYGQVETGLDAARRYSPPVCIGAEKVRIIGRPDMDLVSTSYVERVNLTIRMQQRRFTRLTNGFSRKAENHERAVSLFFLYYNFIRPHETLTKDAGRKTTPAMAAGVTSRIWTVEDVLRGMDPAAKLFAA
jgi:IS1 family transposase